MKLFIITLGFLLTVACAEKAKMPNTPPQTKFSESELIKKNSEIFHPMMESAPFVWNEEIYVIISIRTFNPGEEKYLQILNYKTKDVISEFGHGLDFPSVIVDGETLHIFSVKNHGSVGISDIYKMTTTDLVSFSEPILIHEAKVQQGIFNTSVAATDDGFVLVYETSEPNEANFNARFLKSKDLNNFEETGGFFGSGFYAACPTIRFLKNQYYMWYLVRDESSGSPVFKTQIARSTDLKNWEFSDRVFLEPGEGEGNNNSDMDLVEFDGKLKIFYAIGDQLTWVSIKVATFEGTLEELVSIYFTNDAQLALE